MRGCIVARYLMIVNVAMAAAGTCHATPQQTDNDGYHNHSACREKNFKHRSVTFPLADEFPR
jgi:hypothetical protein